MAVAPAVPKLAGVFAHVVILLCLPSLLADAAPVAPVAIAPVGVMTVREDPQFAKYFKCVGLATVVPRVCVFVWRLSLIYGCRLVSMGMPRDGVEIKMRSEGIEPSLLDHPDDPSPNANALAPIGECDSL